MKYFVQETREYIVEAETEDKARELFEMHGPEVSIEEPIVENGIEEVFWFPEEDRTWHTPKRG